MIARGPRSPSISRFLACGLALWLLVGCGREEDGLRVIFTGETLGELEPCHCGGFMAGGLPRRGGYLKQNDGPALRVDVGCMGAGARDFELLRLDAVRRAMQLHDYHAANVGEHELWLGLEGLQRRAEEFVPLVSANVTDVDGEPAVATFRQVNVGGLQVVVTGVTADDYQPGLGLRVDDPVEALGRYMSDFGKAGDHIVVLADLELATVRELVGLYPEIDLVAFRARGNAFGPEVINRTVVASVGGDARFIADLTLRRGEQEKIQVDGGYHELDRRYPEDEETMREAVAWYKDQVRDRVFDLHQPAPGWERLAPPAPATGNKYVGSAQCKSCHRDAYAAWQASSHARAMESLRSAGYDWSPECVGCHVVGYGAHDGYQSMAATAQLGDVGCESCHGRGGQHVKAPAKSNIHRGRMDDCRGCHTMKRSEHFVRDKAWMKIRH